MSPMRLLAGLLLCLVPLDAAGAVSTVLTADTDQVRPTGLHRLDDPDGVLSFFDVVAGQAARRFEPASGSAPSLGISNAVHWLRFSVHNGHPTRQEWILANTWPLTQRMDIWVERPDGSFTHLKGGLIVGPADKTGGHHFHWFRVEIPRAVETRVYVRLESPAPLVADLLLWAPGAFEAHEERIHFMLGLHYGALLALVLANLLFFVTLRDRSHLYYALFMGTYVAYHSFFWGFAAEWAWPDQPSWTLAGVLMLSGMLMWTGLGFLRVFLPLARYHPRLDRFIRGLGMAGLAAPLVGVVSYVAATWALVGLSGVAGTAALAAMLLLWRRRHIPAVQFLVAWSVMLLGALLQILLAAGAIDSSLFIEYLFHAGTDLGGILLALVLGRRILLLHQAYGRELRQTLDLRTRELHDQVASLDAEAERRRLAEEKLRRTRRQLEQANAEREQLANATSRVLRQPLDRVGQHLTALATVGAALEPRAGGYVERAAQGAQRMSQLIDDLLTYARLAGSAPVRKLVSSHVLVQRVLQDLDAAIETAGAQVTLGTLPMVTGDPARLQRLFQNLLGNALKFRGERRPEIRVEAHREDGVWRFEVRDNGIGIDPRFRERIFAIFQRLHTLEEYEGTGLGLALCKKIVEQHDGRIWADDNPGGGSVFAFTLPPE